MKPNVMASTPKLTDCACFNVRKTARVLARAYDRALEPSGLRNTQFAALALIAGRAPTSITELSKAMEIERTTLTRNLKVLVRDGLVIIEPGADARSRQIRATAEGLAVLKKSIPLWEEAQGRVFKQFGKRRWSSLQGELRAVARAARPD